MKTLLILRHAKTQSDAPAGDHARELTERGHRNAAAMGAYIHNLTRPPDAIITSDATRALQTAEVVAAAGNLSHGGYLGGLACALTTGRVAGARGSRFPRWPSGSPGSRRWSRAGTGWSPVWVTITNA